MRNLLTRRICIYMIVSGNSPIKIDREASNTTSITPSFILIHFGLFWSVFVHHSKDSCFFFIVAVVVCMPFFCFILIHWYIECVLNGR